MAASVTPLKPTVNSEDDHRELVSVCGNDADIVKEILNRLFKSSVDSDWFKAFKAVAVTHPEPATASTMAEDGLRRMMEASRCMQKLGRYQTAERTTNNSSQQ